MKIIDSTAAAARRTKIGLIQQPKPYSYGPVDRRPNLTKIPEFRFTAIVDAHEFPLSNVESVTWDDADAMMTGQVTTRDMAYGAPNVTLRAGDQIRCDVNEGHGFDELWTMRCYEPSLKVSEAQRSYALKNDLWFLQASRDDWFFPTDKAHKKGWYVHEIIEAVCKRYGIPAYVQQTEYRAIGFPRQRKEVSPYDVIREAINLERQHRGRMLTIKWVQGMLQIVPLKRSPHLLGLGPTLVEAAYAEKLDERFASVVSVRALKNEPLHRDSKGLPLGIPDKVHTRIVSDQSVTRYGLIHRVLWSPKGKTEGDLWEQGQRWLAEVAKPVRTIELTHPGIPHLARGDAIKLAFGDEGLQQRIVWVTDISHSLSADDYTMVVTLSFDDVYQNYRDRVLLSLTDTQQEAGRKARKKFRPLRGNLQAPKTPEQDRLRRITSGIPGGGPP